MAACCRGPSTSWRLWCDLRHISLDFSGSNGMVFIRHISMTQLCHKKTPHTVGVPAWAKAAGRRRKVLAKMEKPKSDEQIKAEFNLANDSTELSLYTTTRGGPPSNFNEEDSQIEKPKITMSADKTMFVCYHPARPFPLQFSKEVDTRQWWQKDGEHVQEYRDSLTDEERKEVMKLRKADPKLWTVNALSHMLKVKPLAVMLAAPLSDDQKFEVEVEHRLLNEWPEIKRKTYRANQELERLRYFQSTRGVGVFKKRDENIGEKVQNARNDLRTKST
ncbi:uncharacterized protein [Montipora capricornis]|uniref:uncharacterized protein n=1 Tax=Montipora capricornis TaxID=246305 RepID=UPI0035F1BAA0